MRLVVRGFLLLSLAVSGSAASIAGSRNSTNSATPALEERSKRELRSASRALRSARLAYRVSDTAGLIESVLAIERGVDRAYSLLVETGENPRDSPASFKQAEIQMRRLYRTLEFVQTQVSNQDRAILEVATVKIERLQHELLIGIASGTNLKSLDLTGGLAAPPATR